MKILILLFLLVSSQQIIAQKALEIARSGSDKVKVYKENKRVKVRTVEGGKHIGRFRIINDQTIEIEGNIIPLDEIENIKSRSVGAGIAGTALIIYGAVVMVSGLVIGLNFDNKPIAIAGSFGGVILASGIFFNEFAKNHRDAEWSYKIIDQ